MKPCLYPLEGHKEDDDTDKKLHFHVIWLSDRGVIGIKLNVADRPASSHLMSESCQPQYNSVYNSKAGAGVRGERQRGPPLVFSLSGNFFQGYRTADLNGFSVSVTVSYQIKKTIWSSVQCVGSLDIVRHARQCCQLECWQWFMK